MNLIFGEVLSQLDSRLVYILAGLLAISVIIALIKKAIKLAIIVGVIAFAISSLGPMASDFQNKYQLEVNRDKAVITIDNQKTQLSKEDVSKLLFVNNGLSGYTITVKYNDGIGSVNVPTFMVKSIKDFAENQGIPVEVRE